MSPVMSTTSNAVGVGRRCLRAGRHQHPGDGMCLMEYVSILAGDEFTDAPRCTDPLLAELARMVNDSIGGDVRPELASLATGLVQLPRNPRAAPAIVGAALDAALKLRPGRKDLRRHRRRSLRHAASQVPHPTLPDRLRCTFYRHGPARHALACAVYVVSAHSDSESARDTALVAMLEQAMAAARGSVRARSLAGV